ncbi:hypothetical protein [Microbacterium sp. No. 7]|uniref:hypothetical protein n=1 Tax=Microbacterium sp. No. 7 TaxID=1714373 RepID=UPI0006CF4BA7|nr:hypothetical protein [Microbacterium sp. No. 7]ALJ20836.1 response regulator [Microbacterium sp. No. 7]
MAIARLLGGPLDGQIVPLGDTSLDRYIAPYGEGQIVYHREGALTHTGSHDGPTEATFRYVGSTEDIAPDGDGREA